MNTYQDAPAWPKFENLPGFKPTGEDKFTACCPGPSHSRGDHKPSLGIVIGQKQQIVPTCFVDCTREEILAAMGVQERDLYPPRVSSARAEQEKPLRLEDAVTVYDYTDESDTILFKVGRFANPKDFRPFSPAGPTWKLGEKGIRRHVPYHLPKLNAASPDEVVLILEGEKDVERAERLGFIATTTHGGAKGLAKSAAELAAAVKGHKVAIIPDADDPGDRYAVDAGKAVFDSAASVVMIKLPGLEHRKEHGEDLSDWFDRGHAPGDLYVLIAEAFPINFAEAEHDQHTSEKAARDGRDGSDDEEADSKENKGRGPSQGTMLVQMVVNLPGATLFHTPHGESFASVPVNGHIETWSIYSASFKRWLRNLYYTHCDTSPGEQGVTEARATLEGIALFQGEEQSVSIRLAEHEDDVYLDLGDPNWRAVKITSTGWEIITNPSVRFRRGETTLPLPDPKRGGSIATLRPFVNVNEQDWILLTSWLLAAFRPSGVTPFPYPLLSLFGEQGSAKTTTARIVRSLVDPSSVDVRAEPREARDLAIAAKSSWVLAYDNLDHVLPWFSNALCRLSTGGAFAIRSLYTNDEETIFSAQRPVILTGIEEVVSRGDLLDRSLLLSLPVIDKRSRRPEKEMWTDFEAKRPAILGALLDAVVAALAALPTVTIAELPRMADFALWATAGESALGHEKRAFVEAYTASQSNANQVALEASLVATTLRAWWEKRLAAQAGDWEGTATELLTLLEAVDEKVTKRREWPKTGRGLSGELKRAAPNLRAAEIDIIFGERKNKARLLTIRTPEKKAAQPSQPSPPSQAGNEAGSRSDGRGDGRQNGVYATVTDKKGDNGPSDENGNRHPNRHLPDALEFPLGDGSDGGDGWEAAIQGDLIATIIKIVTSPRTGCPQCGLRDITIDAIDGSHSLTMCGACFTPVQDALASELAFSAPKTEVKRWAS